MGVKQIKMFIAFPLPSFKEKHCLHYLVSQPLLYLRVRGRDAELEKPR